MKLLSLSCFHSRFRCDHFDPGDHWFYPDGSRAGFGLDPRSCQHWNRHGDIEQYCKVDCDIDGLCTETVKQRKCGCPSSGNNPSKLAKTCYTAEYRVLY